LVLSSLFFLLKKERQPAGHFPDSEQRRENLGKKASPVVVVVEGMPPEITVHGWLDHPRDETLSDYG